MDEKDSMTPDTIPQSTPVDGTVPAGRKNRRPVVVGVAAAVAVVLAVGGVCGYRAWEDHRVSVARGACGSAVAAQKKAVDSYRTLLASDDTANALKTDVKDVKDPRSVTVLRKKATMRMPGMVSCDASSVDGLDAARKKADGNAKRVDKASKSLGNVVRTVESSKLDKIVADADGLYKATEGKVQDDKTRASLLDAIKKTRRGRHCEGREGGQRFEDGEGEGRCRGRREGAGRTGGRGPGGRRTAGPTAGAGATLVLVWFVFVRRLVRFRQWTVLFRRIVFRRLPERELPRAKHPLRLGRQYWGSIQLPAG
ncbi:colicin uptake related membrane protein [Bifidobacterium adolescentis JCM 15918]|uniref:Colicin uptake related membrane protein n=1 Tax=Bifidobacterium adolescentis JCM 15918 TaxID=1437612 RepID=A0A087DS36_BIFAD|nr:colicin uptake related membrane protein [Bifidobacterium adolescentis JCM 15918]